MRKKYLKESGLVTANGQFDQGCYLKKKINFEFREENHYPPVTDIFRYCDIFKGEIVFEVEPQLGCYPKVRSTLNNISNLEVSKMRILGIANSDFHFDFVLKDIPTYLSFEMAGFFTIFNTSPKRISRGDLIIWRLPEGNQVQGHRYPIVKHRLVLETYPVTLGGAFDVRNVLGVAQSNAEPWQLFDIILEPRLSFILNQVKQTQFN